MTQTITSTTTNTGSLALAVANNGALHLSCSALGIDGTTTDALTVDVWHHLLLRISGEFITLYVDGAHALSKYLSAEGTLTTSAVTLGGYIGYMDEFVFRRNAGSSLPEVPTQPYDTNVVVQTVEVPSVATSNAPVSRVAWSCENLPAGLILASTGILSGRPTTAGTYECDVSVATNWGTATKKLNIKVN